jgi:hypothetical protein
VQLWADAGVLVADPGTDREGSGRHRRFSRNEAVIACIVAPFAAEKVAIGGLRAIATGVRNIQRSGSRFETRALDDALAGKGKNFIAISTFPVEGKTAYQVTPLADFQMANPLGAFLAEATMSGAKLNVLSLDAVLRPLRAIED